MAGGSCLLKIAILWAIANNTGVTVCLLCCRISMLCWLAGRQYWSYHNHGRTAWWLDCDVIVICSLPGVRKKASFLPWFLVLLISYESHVILDFFTYGPRGVMLFWPITAERFISPIFLFHGGAWSAGVYTSEHL